MKTIICSVDFSDGSRKAALYAASLASEFSSRLVLLHIYKTPSALSTNKVRIPDNTVKTVRRRQLNQLKDELELKNRNIRIDTLLKNGHTVNRIIEVAAEEVADLLVMGSKGKGNSLSVSMGGTALKVISKVHIPVLYVPEGAEYKVMKKIVYATDLTDENINSSLLLLTFAKHFNSELVFLYVSGKLSDAGDEVITEMTRKIRAHVRYARLSGYLVSDKKVAMGITYFIQKNETDLLVFYIPELKISETFLKHGTTRSMIGLSPVPLLAIPAGAYSLTNLK